jgi:hypothetical protein
MLIKAGGDYSGCGGQPVLDQMGSFVKVNAMTGLVKVDGIPVFRIVTGQDGVKVQFADNDRLRSRSRGTRFVEVPIIILFEKLVESGT